MIVPPAMKIDLDERRQRVFELKKRGLSDREIQRHLSDQGITVSHMTVNKDWNRVLKDSVEKRSVEIDAMKALQNVRYETIIAAHWAKATGWKLADPDSQADPDPRSAEVVMKAIKGIRELYGLDNKVGTSQNPLTLNLPPMPEEDIELDLEGMTDDELARFHDVLGAIIEAKAITEGTA